MLQYLIDTRWQRRGLIRIATALAVLPVIAAIWIYRHDPNDPDPNNSPATDVYDRVVYLRTVARDYPAAMALAETFLLTADPSDTTTQMIHYEYACVFHDERDYPNARAEFIEITRRYSLPPEADRAAPETVIDDAEFMAACVALEAGDGPTAARELTTFIIDWPQSNEIDHAHLLLGRAHEELNDGRAALAEYEHLVAQYPNSSFVPDAQFGVGRLRAQAGDYQGALAAFRAVVTNYATSEFAPRALEGATRLLATQLVSDCASGGVGNGALLSQLEANVQRSLADYPLAHETLELLGHAANAAAMVEELGLCERPTQGLMASGQAVIDEMTAIDPVARATLTAQLSRAYWRSYRDPSQAVWIADDVVAAAVRSNQAEVQRQALFARGQYEKRSGNVAAAQATFDAVGSLSNAAGDTVTAGRAELSLAGILAQEGDWRTAERAYANIAADGTLDDELRAYALYLRHDAALRLHDYVAAESTMTDLLTNYPYSGTAQSLLSSADPNSL